MIFNVCDGRKRWHGMFLYMLDYYKFGVEGCFLDENLKLFIYAQDNCDIKLIKQKLVQMSQIST